MTGPLLIDLGVECNQYEPPDFIEECRRDIIPMKEYARVNKWDTRLRIAFEVICCTFILVYIKRISLHYDLGINKSSGKKIHKKNKRIIVNSFIFEVKRRYSKIG